MKKANSITLIAADPPIPTTGGGTRTLHFLKAISAVTSCNLFVLFPIRTDDLPVGLLNSCKIIQYSKTAFAAKSKGRMDAFIHDLRLLFFPWSFAKEEVILSAGYFITNPYEGENTVRRIFLYFLKRALAWYVLFIYRSGYSMPARSLERLNQFRELEPAIAKAIESSDLLWIDFSYLLPFFKGFGKTGSNLKIICNAHNIEYKLLERLETLSKNNLERKWYKSQAAIMKKEELKGFSNCDLIITCSEEDRNELQKQLPSAHIENIPNGVDIDYFVPHSVLTKEPSLLFTGTMGYAPNKDAVEYFIEKIFPYVSTIHPTCTFIIAGANAGEVFKKYAGTDNIEIVSSPADMRPIYDKAWIVVVPLRSGSGTRLKILEAMAMEKPVVSTTIGAEGISVKDSVELFIADEEKDFAAKIDSLIKNKGISTSITRSAKETISALYSWKRIREITIGKILELN